MRFNYTYKITYESGQCYDRWNNLDGTSRTTPFKKERDIARIELRIPEDEDRRIRKMKNPLKTLTQPINQLEIPRNSDAAL